MEAALEDGEHCPSVRCTRRRLGLTGIGARPPVSRNGAAPVSVYVVDDHAGVLAGLVSLIDAAEGFSVVGSSMSAQTAVDEILSIGPEVAVVDGDVAGFDGLDLCRQIGALGTDVTCVLMTAGLRSRWTEGEIARAPVSAVVFKQLIDFSLLEVIGKVAGAQSAGGSAR